MASPKDVIDKVKMVQEMSRDPSDTKKKTETMIEREIMEKEFLQDSPPLKGKKFKSPLGNEAHPEKLEVLTEELTESDITYSEYPVVDERSREGSIGQSSAEDNRAGKYTAMNRTMQKTRSSMGGSAVGNNQLQKITAGPMGFQKNKRVSFVEITPTDSATDLNST